MKKHSVKLCPLKEGSMVRAQVMATVKKNAGLL